MKKIIVLLLLSSIAFADTPPPGAVKIKGGTDGTLVGNVGDQLKVTASFTPSGIQDMNLKQFLGATPNAANPIPFQLSNGVSYYDARNRLWSLSSGSDSVGVTQITNPWVTARNWALTFAGDKVDASGSSVAISNPATNYALESGGHLASIDTKIPASPSQDRTSAGGPSSVRLSDGTSFYKGTTPSDTQPVSAASLPLPSNAAQEAGGHLSSIDTKLTAPLTTNATLQAGTANIGHVDGEGVAGTPSGGVLSIQGVASGTAVPISGTVTTTPSGNQTVVQPTGTNLHTVVDSGSITANAGTNLNTSALALDATLTGGTQKTQINNGANTAAVKAASTAAVATDPALVVAVSPNNSVAVTQATAANLNATVVQSSGSNLHVNVDSAPTTTVTGTVTANAGTNLNTSLLQLDTTGAKLNNTQGSTTSGQSGPLVQGAVTTSAPTYTTAQTSPLSLTTAGALRTDASATTQPVSGTVTANAGSGTFTVSGTVTANAGTNLNTSALATSANQTTLGSQTTKVNDGTNTSAVKAASTAAVATDPALVVTLSPNGNQAKDTSVTGLQVTQGSTTSGQSGTLIQAAVTTNDPGYTNAQTSPLTQNVRGGLRIVGTGMDSAQTPIRNDYSSTNVTTAAYVQLIASTSAEIHRIQVFDSSGQDFVLATGGAGSEVDQIQIPPGGWDAPVDLFIASGTRVSIKSKSATASSGILLLTVLK